jgi:ornithine cyclodeaminase/alanine dehydrogenase-like protein (mu-crystallin family)
MNKNNLPTLVLNADDIEKIVSEVGIDELMDKLIEEMTNAFINYNSEITKIPIRSGFNYQKPNTGLVEWMPLYDKKHNDIVVKLVGYHPDNPAKYDLPTIISTISCYDTLTGHLKGIMDGVFLTALRTGAASAVASKVFSHPDSKILGLIGCGAQAVTQLHALSRVFPIEKVLYYDIDKSTCESFAERIQMLDLEIELVHSSMEEIVQQSDIITTATSLDVGAGPLFDDISTQAHLHINAIGSDFPGKTELPKKLLQKAFVSPDFLAQAIIEGECQQLEADQIGEEFFMCIQQTEKYKELRDRLTVFDSTGLPLEDSVIMKLFFNYAKEMNLGKEIHIERIPIDAKSPYEFIKEPALELKSVIEETTLASDNLSKQITGK